MIFYAIYNAPLLLTAHPSSTTEMSIGFVDNVMFLAMARSLKEAHKVLADMMERTQGSFDWSQQHNFPFKLTKLVLMNFPHSLAVDDPSSLTLLHTNSDRPQTIQSVAAVPTYRYLGVYFDSKLCWSAHAQKVATKATWWSL
ncbi:hypothetical protein J132_10228 [Termitomyces sp. J132]|nr:hypothetical protein J132_10228 [Termitomyces sp. J132]